MSDERDALAETTDTFTSPCLACGSAIGFVSGQEQPHHCQPADSEAGRIAHAFWSGYDRGKVEHDTAVAEAAYEAGREAGRGDMEAIEREAQAKAYDDGYNDAATMARCYGHTDHWPEDDEPRNPYRALSGQPAAARAEGDECPVTGLNPCPYHPDGGNHPTAAGDQAEAESDG